MTSAQATALLCVALLSAVAFGLGASIVQDRVKEPWTCDAKGRVIVDRLPEDERMDAIDANIRLTGLRIRALGGEHWIDPDQLVKAQGCP